MTDDELAAVVAAATALLRARTRNVAPAVSRWRRIARLESIASSGRNA